MHVFITGERGIGKTTLLKLVAEQFPKERIHGFFTEKIAFADEKGEQGNIFMFAAGADDNECHAVAQFWGDERKKIFSKVFDTYGVSLLEHIPDGSLVIMDELGFLENDATHFQEKVLEVLDQKVMVLGVIKPKVLPFLEAVRHHPRVQLFNLTKQDQKQQTQKVQELMKLLVKE